MATSWERDTSLEKERFPHVHRKIHPPWMMATGIVSSKLADCTERPSHGPALVHLVIETVGGRYASTDLPGVYCGVPAGLAMSLAWSFLHASGL
jgi:hypothetical protein